MAEHCYHNAHYAAGEIAKLPGYEVANGPSTGSGQPFFQEFVVRCPQPPADVNRALLERGMIGGYDVSDHVDNGLLLCFSDLHTRDEIDRLVSALGTVSG